MNPDSAAAKKLKSLLIEVSPIIEEYTRATCPSCSDVCCRQKHGMYRERDVWYLQALGIPLPERNTARPPEGPCEAMGGGGCVQPRWMRPFKCTWYFCDPLLKALNGGPQKKSRKLTAVTQEMINLYGALEGPSPSHGGGNPTTLAPNDGQRASRV